MPRIHSYGISVTWTGNRGTGTSGYRAYQRDHDVTAEGRPVIAGSSAGGSGLAGHDRYRQEPA